MPWSSSTQRGSGSELYLERGPLRHFACPGIVVDLLLLPAKTLRDIVLDCKEATMAWLRIRLTEEQQQVVNEERSIHPNPRIREKMLVLWLLHHGVTRENAAKIVGVGRATVQRYVAAFREGGLEGLRQWNPNRPVSEMAAYRELIRESFEKQPVRTVAEACERIFQLTGLRRGPSQVRKFAKDMGLKFLRVRPIPVPPKKTWLSTSRSKQLFTTPN